MGVNIEQLNTVIYRMLNNSTDLKTAISGRIYKGGFRPQDSVFEDIGINTVSINRNNPQDAVSNINLYVKDKQQNINGKLEFLPDYLRLETLSVLVVNALKSALIQPEFAGFNFFIMDERTAPNNSTLPEHYKNFKIRFIIPNN